MNQVQILGTMTKDVEVKYTQSGTAIGNFGVAYNDKWKDQSGELKEKAHFFDVSVFGKQVETIRQYFKKGSRILISGSLDFQSWQDQQGNNRSKVGIKLSRFDFIDRKSDSQGGQQPSSQPQQNGYATDNPSPQPQYQQQAAPQQQPQQGHQVMPLVPSEDELPF